MERKKPEGQSERWRTRCPIRLYLDDVEELLSILGEVAVYVEAETDEYYAITASELASVLRPIKPELIVRGFEDEQSRDRVGSMGDRLGQKELARVTLKRIPFQRSPDISIVVASNAAHLAGAMAKARKVIAQRRAWWRQTRLVLVSNMVFLVCVVLGFTTQLSGWSFLLGLPFGVIVFVDMLTSRFGSRSPVRIVPSRRANAPRFFRRNQENLAVNFLVGLFFYVVGLVSGHLFLHQSKPK